MKLYGSAAATKPCFKLLEEIHECLANHHELPGDGDDRDSFSSIVTRAVVSPVKSLSTLVEAQQRAILSLTKSVESLKNTLLLSLASPALPPPRTQGSSFAAAEG
jgi:hypothetical protein